MINLPHIGLYGDLSACEDGMIDALNRNFSLLDAIVQLKVLDFVTELPEDPEKGDVYILNTPLDPSTDKDLMIFNGTNWVQIIPQDGFIAYIDSEEAFYYYNDGEWIKDLTDLSEIKLKLGRATSTGVIDGLNLSTASGDNTKFDVASGIYEIVDLSDVNNPVVKTIQYAGSTGNTVTNLATQDVTYISLDEDGVIHQSINYPTPNERRQYAFVGRLNHTNRTSISFADTFPDFKLSPVASFYDLVDALAPFKMDQGLKTTPNGANLSFDVSAGKVFFRSDNYATDKNNPHTKTFNDQVLAPFRKMTQTSTVDAADVTVLEPSYYDVAGVRTLIAGGPNHATIQRIYKYKSGAIRVAYGQNIYTNLNDAREAVNFDSFVENPTINQTAVLIALVIVTKGCTDLSDPSQCVILPASRFGSVSGGGGGGTGSGVMVVSDLTARNNIPEGTRTNGMLVEVISTDTIYKLIGLPAGATTTDANWDPVITGKAAQVITNKDIDGGTASNTSRITAPKNTKENLDILNRKEGALLFGSDTKKLYFDDGENVVELKTTSAEDEPIGIIKEIAGLYAPFNHIRIDTSAKLEFEHTDNPELFGIIGDSFGKSLPRFSDIENKWASSLIGSSGESIVKIAYGEISSVMTICLVTTGHVYLSTNNGVSWTATALTTTGQFTSVGYAPASPYFIVTDSVGIIQKYSGSTWTAQTVRASATFEDILWVNSLSLWVLVASNGTTAQQIYTSPAIATTWTARTVPTAVGTWKKITLWNGILVLSGAAARVIYSANATAWTNVVISGVNEVKVLSKEFVFRGLAPDEVPDIKGFIGVAKSSSLTMTHIYHSLDAVKWTQILSIPYDLYGGDALVFAEIIDSHLILFYSTTGGVNYVGVMIRLSDVRNESFSIPVGDVVFNSLQNKQSYFLPDYDEYYSGKPFVSGSNLLILNTMQTHSRIPKLNRKRIIEEVGTEDSGYKIFHDGSIEQWGRTTVASSAEIITFPVEMYGSYWASAGVDFGFVVNTGNAASAEISTKTSKTMTIHHVEYGGENADRRYGRSVTSSWIVKGWVANKLDSSLNLQIAEMPFMTVMRVR